MYTFTVTPSFSVSNEEYDVALASLMTELGITQDDVITSLGLGPGLAPVTCCYRLTNSSGESTTSITCNPLPGESALAFHFRCVEKKERTLAVLRASYQVEEIPC